ncbi:hypothetical protein V2J09_012491 [Rumex salicifolius]
MAALIARRLSSKSKFLNPRLSSSFSSHVYKSSDSCLPNPNLDLQKPNLLTLIKFSSTRFVVGAGSTAIQKPYQGLRYFSTSPIDGSNSKEKEQPKGPESELGGFKHQEIEGPTVERDLSSLANETREVTEKLMKNMYGASRVMGIMCVAQLGLGAWISYATRSSPLPEMMLMSAVAFGFPFSMALMLRSTIKPMHFFRKMEELGRLQILTTTMQIAKHLNLFFFRLQGVSYLCVAASFSEAEWASNFDV